MTATPQQIIEAFDQILDFVYGRNRGRDYPSKFDEDTASEWIERGLTVPIASVVFYQQMIRMHERWLRLPPNNRTEIPQHLNIFKENIESILYRMKNGELTFSDKVDSGWRCRLRSWLNGSCWYDNHWGDPPINPTTGKHQFSRVPKYILEEELTSVIDPSKLGPIKQLPG